MKIKLIIALVLACFTVMQNQAKAAGFRGSEQEKDSIIVTFGDKTRLIIYGENRKELEKIMKYDLNALLKDLKVRLDSSTADTTFLREEFNGNNYLKEEAENEKDYVRIGLRGVHVKDGDTRVSIDSRGVEVHDGDRTVNDSTYRRKGKRFYRYGGIGSGSPRKGFNIAVGLNNYGSNEATPGFNKSDYALKPFGSRFISLGYVASVTAIKGEHARLSFDFGGDFSWYNLMFDNNNTVFKTDDQVEFKPLPDNAAGEEIQLRKSKLVVPYVNLSFMPVLSFPGSFISYISAGVYGGYRLGSYTKVRPEGSKDVDRERKNFHVQDLRYGLAAEIGIRKFPDLFVNYDLNNLYVENKGPQVRMLSFGVRLF